MSMKRTYEISTIVSENEEGGAAKKGENGDNNQKDKPTRTAMGEYVVPENGKALTSLGDHRPGPADYSPKVDPTKDAAPHYSIVGKPKSRRAEGENAVGPADYDTGENMVWKGKTATIKGRGRSYFDEQAAQNSTNGPAEYNVEHPLGADGPTYSMARKQPGDRYTGPPNSMVQPVDTHGFDTPGPNYRPNSKYLGRGPEKSFGQNRKHGILDGPGPSDYTIPENETGQAKSFGVRLPTPPMVQRLKGNKDSPAPNTYNLGTTMGKAVSVSITGRRSEPFQPGVKGPGPTAYNLRDSFDKHRKAATLAYRWFDEEAKPSPGPADYEVAPVNLRKYPSYTCRQRTNPTYPENLNYVTKTQEDVPGPGSYNLNRDFAKNDRPAFSMGKRVDESGKHGPGPNAYGVEKYSKPGCKRPPAFSMAKRLDQPDSKVGPGPAAYYPSLPGGAPRYTMTRRPKSRKRFVNPAPNSYTLPSVITPRKNGVVLKSRASPYVYSGFRTTKFADPVSAQS